ncbi:DUF1648 domain-containing protein [Corynebacterium provencense]|uniref:DUF1648 domain-containing protein n=1 Tax=Corynebacterium provencense TaxID=1737425 RepID=UPI0008308FA0|nr:DUF1648 domain-containing protein [Corynebacterium provencense]
MEEESTVPEVPEEEVTPGGRPPVSVPGRLYLLVLLPPTVAALLLWATWNSLPDHLPTHWNLAGDADTWQPKSPVTVLAQLFTVPVVLLLGLAVASSILWMRSGNVFEPGGAGTTTEALNIWHGAKETAPVVGRYFVLLSLAATVTAAGGYLILPGGHGAGGLTAVAGILGIVASTVYLLLAVDRIDRAVTGRFPLPDGRRRKWLLFLEAPGSESVMLSSGDGWNWTFNVATRAGRMLALLTLVVLTGVSAVLVVSAVVGV